MSPPGDDERWSYDGLPDLPPEWGPVVVPDDAAELADEAAEVRRELRAQARRAAWRRRLGPVAGPRGTVRLPLMLLAVAIVTTLASLFAVIWPTVQRPQDGRGAAGAVVSASPAGRPPGAMLPALDLVGEGGGPVPLRSLLPALILLVDGCECPDDVDAAARVVPPGVTVVPLGRGRTPRPGGRSTGPAPVRPLTDPTGELRAFLRTPARPDAPTAALVDRSGRIVRVVPAVGSVEDYRPDLPQLVG
jgi:hypothetical protein